MNVGDILEYNRTHDSRGRLKPTVKEPSLASLERQMNDGVVKATDGCRVEPDGHCPHGHVSWLIYLGYI